MTRTPEQSGPLCAAIELKGWQCIRFPCMNIRGPRNPESILAYVDQLDDYNKVIFVSAHAVAQFWTFVGKKPWPKATRACTLGAATATKLNARGVERVLVPTHGHDSESLLELDEFNHVQNQRVLLVNAPSGRQLIEKTLKERGAHIDIASVYQREIGCPSTIELEQSLKRGELPIVIITSRTLLEYFYQLARGIKNIKQLPIVTVSQRIVDCARSLGFKKIELSPGMTVRELISSVECVRAARLMGIPQL